MSGQIAPDGPFTTEIVFHFTNGEYDAQVSFDAPPGRLADADGVAILAAKALAAITNAQGEGWRFKTRAEFVQSELTQRSGAPASVKFAVPAGEFSMEWAA